MFWQIMKEQVIFEWMTIANHRQDNPLLIDEITYLSLLINFLQFSSWLSIYYAYNESLQKSNRKIMVHLRKKNFSQT